MDKPQTRILMTPRAKRALAIAGRTARGFGHNYLGIEHLLIGCFESADDGTAHDALKSLGLDRHKMRDGVRKFIRKITPESVSRSSPTNTRGRFLKAHGSRFYMGKSGKQKPDEFTIGLCNFRKKTRTSPLIASAECFPATRNTPQAFLGATQITGVRRNGNSLIRVIISRMVLWVSTIATNETKNL